MVLSRQQVPVGQWAAELAKALVRHAGENAETAQALRRLVAGRLYARIARGLAGLASPRRAAPYA